MRLVVGLGNPGSEYANTPHNLGFLVADRLAEAHSVRVTRKECMALVGEGSIAGCEVMLAKPMTYMNASGPSVKGLLVKLDLKPADLLLIYDELDLPFGAVRVRPRGSDAGHNGVSSVIQSVGTELFPRIRMGIHPGHPVRDGAGYVLRPFKRSLQEEVDELVGHTVLAVESVLAEGVEKAMAKFNRRARGLTTEEE
jgi:peptidyl-tRNA hydrolase, PTH1 family